MYKCDGAFPRIRCTTSLESNYHARYLLFPAPALWGGLGVVCMYLRRFMYVCIYLYVYVCYVRMYVCDGDGSWDWVYYLPGIQLSRKVYTCCPAPLWGGLGVVCMYLRRLVGIDENFLRTWRLDKPWNSSSCKRQEKDGWPHFSCIKGFSPSFSINTASKTYIFLGNK